MKPGRIVLCTAVLTFFIAALARARYTPPGSDNAVLRFSWRMSVSAKENCRTRTQEELDALPVHMRTPEVCTRDAASYSLVARIDEQPPDTIQLVRGGVKGDRPIFVLEERTLSPGHHRVRIDLERRTDSRTKVLAALDTTLRMEAGRIQLITLAAEARRLTALSSAHCPERQARQHPPSRRHETESDDANNPCVDPPGRNVGKSPTEKPASRRHN